MKTVSPLIIAALLLLLHTTDSTNLVDVTFVQKDISIQLKKSALLSLVLNASFNETTELTFTYQGDGGVLPFEVRNIVLPLPNITVERGCRGPYTVSVTGCTVGHVYLGINSTSEEFVEQSGSFCKVSVVHLKLLDIMEVVVGWIYFAAWTVSFYPQLWLNWSRKSVVGLNFDFIVYHVTGFVAYGIFNIGFYWIDSVKAAYYHRHPRGVIQVELNDVVFCLHAVLMGVIVVIQCLIYDRGGQRVSRFCLVLTILIVIAFSGLLVPTALGYIALIDYLYYFSYLKLGVTLFKTLPQVYMNYRLKSTAGWSIMAVFLDFVGGCMSILQMVILAYNNDDWMGIFGDPTKFGLGAYSMVVDFLFFAQHYCLYPRSKNKRNISFDTSDDTEQFLVNA